MPFSLNNFAKIVNKQLKVNGFKDSFKPQNLKECLWSLFVVRCSIPKSKVIDITSIKKSTSAYIEY